MPVNYATPVSEALFPVAGVRLGTAEAGIGKKNQSDLTLIAVAQELAQAVVRAASDREEDGSRIMQNAMITVWTCDFSYDYVRIKADYRT